jgi:hypothetical protein
MAFYGVSFRDANFEHRFVQRGWLPDGRPRWRWEPFGMPRLNLHFPNSVVFLYLTDPEKDVSASPEGTGFLVSAQEGPSGVTHVYVVTCHHVGPAASFVRINTKDGASRVIDTEPGQWQFFEDSDDVAIFDINDELSATDDYVCVDVSTFLTEKLLGALEIGPGEDSFMLGLFAPHPGTKRNLVAARFGNISLLASEEDTVKQGNQKYRPSHIVDMRSRSGFSGSPVFVYRTPSSDLRDEALYRKRTQGHRTYTLSQRDRDSRDFGDSVRAQHELEDWIAETDNGRNIFLRFLGMHSAQLREPLTVYKEAEGDTGLSVGEPVRVGDKLSVQSSMTVVVPAWRIWDLLHHDRFARQRNARTMREAKKDRMQVDPESTGGVVASSSAPTPAAEAEPDHREAFNRLVAKAATAKPKDDRT